MLPDWARLASWPRQTLSASVALPLGEAHILGMAWSSFGALLILVGALLLLFDAASGRGLAGLTWEGTLAEVRSRLAAAVALIGSLLVLAGSAILVAQAGVTFVAVVVVLVAAGAAVPVVMGYHLRKYLNNQAIVDAGVAQPRSLWWCIVHPRAGVGALRKRED